MVRRKAGPHPLNVGNAKQSQNQSALFALSSTNVSRQLSNMMMISAYGAV